MLKMCKSEYINCVSIIPIVSFLLGEKFARILFMMATMLAAKKIKRFEFAIKSVTNEYFDELLKSVCEINDFLGDKRSCCIVSMNSLGAIKSSSKCWLQISSNQSTNTDEVEDGEISFANLMPDVPGAKDKENCKDCKIKNNTRLVQCLVVEGIVIEDRVLYVTQDTHHNIKQCLGIEVTRPLNHVNVSNEGHVGYPQIAEKAVVAPIVSSYEMLQEDFDEIIRRYFETPRYCLKNDVFSIVLKEEVPHFQWSAPYFSINEISFKVLDVVGTSSSSLSSYLGCYIVKDHTSLFLNSGVTGYLPARTLKNSHHPLVGNPQSDQPLCPDGLTKYVNQLKNIFQVFQRGGYPDDMKPYILVTGPRGCGKKSVVYCAAMATGFSVYKVDCFDLYGIGASMAETKWEALTVKVKKSAPCILLLSNIELIGRERDDSEDSRLVHGFLSKMRELQEDQKNPVIVVGVSEASVTGILPSIARIFIHTVTIHCPRDEEVLAILRWILESNAQLYDLHALERVATRVSGYLFRDLDLLVRKAAICCRDDDTEDRRISEVHFQKAIDAMEAAYSESIGAPRIPTVRWEDVGGLADLKEEIMLTLDTPMKHPELMASGLRRSGLLLYGPPGTGKTLLAKAVATEYSLNFLSVKGPELLNMYVGQSERNVREVFERARDAAPCIIFFDELDSLAPNRGRSGDSGGVADRVVSQLLAEMDGLHRKGAVFVMAATNRPDLVDPALLRPGRFDKMLYVGPCEDDDSKLSVITALCRKFHLAADVKFEELVVNLPHQVTGADIYSVCSNAWMNATRRTIVELDKGIPVTLPLQVTCDDFADAIQGMVPSLNLDDMAYYQQLKSLER